MLHDHWDFMSVEIFTIPSGEDLFNQYKDTNPSVDRPGADSIRRENLKNYLASFDVRPTMLIVGEALGTWGCRFSGVPFTSETQLCQSMLPFTGRQSNNSTDPYDELTAKVFWNALRDHYSKFLAWNCIPFHPFDIRKGPLSVRNPQPAEIQRYISLLDKLYKILRPQRIVAVGRKAENALRSLGVNSVIYVRHPSHGGTISFLNGIQKAVS